MTTSTIRFGCAIAILLVDCCTCALAADPPPAKALVPTRIIGKGEVVTRCEETEVVNGVAKAVTNTYTSRCTIEFWNDGYPGAPDEHGYALVKIQLYKGDRAEPLHRSQRVLHYLGGPNGMFFDRTPQPNCSTASPGYCGEVVGGTSARIVLGRWWGGENVAVQLKLEPSNAFEGVKKSKIWVEMIRGTASILRADSSTWMVLPGGEQIPVTINDKIKTESETRVMLKFIDGSCFRIRSDTILTLMNGGIQLQVGESWFNLQKQGTTFQVVTPTAVTGVLGTTFSVSVKPNGDSTTRLYSGRVQVAHADSKAKVTLNAGEKVSAGAQALSPVGKLAPTESADAWEKAWAEAPAAPAATPPAAASGGELFTVTAPSQGFWLTTNYPRKDFDFEVEVTCTQPGTILDTMGLNQAPTGSWSVAVTADNHLAFNLWDGQAWHTLTSQATISRGTATRVRLCRQGPTARFIIGGNPDASASLPTPLPERAIYVGDFKGDEWWGEGHRIHQGMVGTVRVLYLGVPRP